MTHWLGSVLANETDPYFQQFNESAPCPAACERQSIPGQRVSQCVPTSGWKAAWEARKGQWEKQLMETKGAIAEQWYGAAEGKPHVHAHAHDEL